MRRLKPGDRPKASEWNAIVDALSRVDVSSDRASGPAALPYSGDSVLVYNNTGAALARFAPFRVDKASAEIFNPTSHPGAFYETRPITAETAAGNLPHHSVAVTLEPIAIAGYGRAAISGVVPCVVEVGNVAHKYARLRTDSLVKLDSADIGPVEILWNVGTSGYMVSIVRLGHQPAVFFPVLVTKNAGSAGTDTTACTFTYNVTDLNGTGLGNSMTPAKARGAGGVVATVAAGAYGVGFYNAAGAFVLWDAGETPNKYPAVDTDT